jgi:hypothetical protein
LSFLLEVYGSAIIDAVNHDQYSQADVVMIPDSQNDAQVESGYCSCVTEVIASLADNGTRESELIYSAGILWKARP